MNSADWQCEKAQGATGKYRSRGLRAEAVEAFGASDGVDGVGESQDAVGWGGQRGDVVPGYEIL